MLRAALSLFLGSLAGKIVGVAREVLLASLFGTGSAVAALRVAQTATMIPVQFFVADSLNAAFVPLHSTYAADSQRRREHLFAVVSVLLLGISVVVSAGLLVAAPRWVSLLAPGLDSQTSSLASSFLFVMALSVPFVIISALFSYLEMANRSYTLASLRATVQSIGVVLGTITAYWFSNPQLLAWGFTGAYIFFSGWAVLLLKRSGFLCWPRPWVWRDAAEALEQFWKVLRPLLLLPAMLQGAIAIERGVASLLGTTAVAGLDYAKFITETGVLLLAVPLGLASLATLGGLSRSEARTRLLEVIPALLLLTAPVSAFLTVNAHAVVRLVYQRGAFGGESAAVTGSILGGLALGFWAHVVGYTLVKALNAQLRNREVLFLMAGGLIAQSVLNLSLYRVVGPVALGIGSSAYGVIVFAFTVRAFKLTRHLARHLAWIALGTLLYVPFGLWAAGDTILNCVMGVIAFAVFWPLYVLAVPVLRQTAAGVVRRSYEGRP